MRIRRVGLLAMAGIMACAGAARAHHSTAEFDYGKNVKISGRVIELQWMNPHSFIEVLVPGQGGAATRWSIEIGSPNINRRMGWSRTTVNAGDQVTMEIAPTRDGRPRGTLRLMTLPGNKQIRGIAGLTKANEQGAPLIDPGAVSEKKGN